MRRTSGRRLAEQFLRSALQAVDPAQAVRQVLHVRGSVLSLGSRTYSLQPGVKVVVVGAGKAAARMARAVELVLGSRLTGGCVVTKYGHRVRTARVTVLEAGHPIPDMAGQLAAQGMLELAKGLSSRDLLLVLLSGGASSLLPAPAEGLTLADKQHTTDLLLKCGATIQEVNSVRKHLSAIKGGQLAAATRARVASLILSDVLGDDLSSIGSGITAPDPSTFSHACAVLRRYRLWGKVPRSVREHLRRGVEGGIRETPKGEARLFRRVQNEIIGNNQAAVEAVAAAATRQRVSPLVLTTTLTGEARAAATAYGRLARQVVQQGKPLSRPCCLIAGGELTVTVRGPGKGGRAQEFALAAARAIAGFSHVWVMGVGTDGTDGPTDAAGAVVDGETWARAISRGLDPARALRRNDAYPLLKQLGRLITTGPTGTNVNDLYLLLIL